MIITRRMFQFKQSLKLFSVLTIIFLTFTSVYVIYKKPEDLPDFHDHDVIDIIEQDFTSCYYAENDHQPITLSEAIEMIFFHEINCQTTLDMREACSVESIALTHPNRQVNVLFTKVLTEKNRTTGTLGVLNRYRNVRYYTVDLNSYARNTPIENVFLPRDTSFGRWHYRGISDILKFVTLYKYGGTVVDFNTMVVGSLDKLGDNWVLSKNGSWEVGVFSASRDDHGRYFSKRYMMALQDQLALTGVTMERLTLKEVLTSLCNTSVADEITPQKCKGYRVYTGKFSDFIHGSIATDPTAHNSHLGFLWSDITISDDYDETATIDSTYARLARQYCPRVYYGVISRQIV